VRQISVAPAIARGLRGGAHTALRRADSQIPARDPAVEAGISAYVWSLEEIAKLAD